MAKAQNKLSDWPRSAGPMAAQALNDWEAGETLGQRVVERPHLACAAISFLAQATEKMLKAWLLSYQSDEGLNAVKWFQHDVLGQLQKNPVLRRRRQHLVNMVGEGILAEAGRLLKLIPCAGWARNVEYPFREGAAIRAPCERFGLWDYEVFLKTARTVTRRLEKFVN